MASEVKTNKISPSTSTTVTLGDASDLFQLPASAEIDIASGATLDVNGTIDVTGATVTGLTTGKILQCIQATKDDTWNVVGTTMADITGMTKTITPSAASSTILIMVTLNIGNTSTGFNLQTYRDAVKIAQGTTAGSRLRLTSVGATNSVHSQSTMAFNWIDSPSTTSATVYKLQGCANDAGQTVYLNQSSTYSDSTSYSTTVSSITLMEIGA